LYLVAIIDWATRRVLFWRLSNTLTAGFCVEALTEALARFGKPGIFNTDQGAQFTSDEFTEMLQWSRSRDIHRHNRRQIDGPRLGACRTKIERGPRLCG
jgi:transposase InsO family protein